MTGMCPAPVNRPHKQPHSQEEGTNNRYQQILLFFFELLPKNFFVLYNPNDSPLLPYLKLQMPTSNLTLYHIKSNPCGRSPL